jgi:hypothetical protein
MANGSGASMAATRTETKFFLQVSAAGEQIPCLYGTRRIITLPAIESYFEPV